MDSTTRNALKEYMKKFVRRMSTKVGDFSVEDVRRAFPFHDLFFRDEAIVAFKLQRSIVTSMGMGFYPEIARLIAAQNYHPRLEYPLEVTLDENMCNRIEQTVSELRTAARKPDFATEMDEILSSTGGPPRTTQVIADLYIPDFRGGPLFAELKSPKPNLDVAAESKKKMLYCRAHSEIQEQVGRATFALPYNPYVERGKYNWWPTLQIMDMVEDVTIGEEFWDLVGGESTYEELLRIIADVKREAPLAKRDP